MSTKANLSLIILSAVLLSACTAAKAPGDQTPTGENKTPETEQSSSSSLRDLLASGKNQKCTISTSTTDDKGVTTETTGNMYFSGKKMAQEFVVSSTDKTAPVINMRSISDGTFLYSWNPATKAQGMKVKITDPSDGSANKDTNTNTNSNVGMDDKLNVKCSNWAVDETKFAIPIDVKFTDLSELMKNIPTIPAIPAE